VWAYIIYVYEMTSDKILHRLQAIIPKGERKGMAQKIGVSANTMTNYLKGNTQIPYDAILKIAEFKNVNLQWLLGETDDEKQGEQPKLSEGSSTYHAQEKNMEGEVIIGKMDTIITFLKETYSDLPSMLDDCIYQMKADLRKNNPDFRQWEYEQQDKLMSRRKNKKRESDLSPNIPNEKEANGSQ